MKDTTHSCTEADTQIRIMDQLYFGTVYSVVLLQKKKKKSFIARLL